MIDNWEKKIGGMKPSEFDPRDYKMQVTYGALDLPETYNSNAKYNVHNQGTYNLHQVMSEASYTFLRQRYNLQMFLRHI